MKASEFASKLGNTLKSVVKMAVSSRPVRLHHPISAERRRTLIVLANGPSLNKTLSESADTLKRNDCLSVNFAPLSNIFFDIRPRFHVLADPLFFSKEPPVNVEELYNKLARVVWPMTLLIPHNFRNRINQAVSNNPNISIVFFNFVGLEGFEWFENMAYNTRLGMPRPRNVLIPAIMCGIWLGYKRIYITGADHSWMQTISVDENNNVISVQPHFYKDDKKEQQRVDTTYRNYRLHDIVHSFYVAFRSYHLLQRYAQKKGVEIINSTPGSFIDAFPRGTLQRF